MEAGYNLKKHDKLLSSFAIKWDISKTLHSLYKYKH